MLESAGSQKAPMYSSPPSDTLVLALGNPLRGDDGVGAAVLEALAASESLPENVRLLDGGTAGLETVLLMQGYRRVIVVDAAEMGYVPGEWVRIRPDDAQLRLHDAGGTLHNLGLADALGLGSALGMLPGELVIYGVQPLELGWLTGISEPMRQAIPAICVAILEELSEERT
jgi:hydrogenase maturation protease